MHASPPRNPARLCAVSPISQQKTLSNAEHGDSCIYSERQLRIAREAAWPPVRSPASSRRMPLMSTFLSVATVVVAVGWVVSEIRTFWRASASDHERRTAVIAGFVVALWGVTEIT